MKKQDLENALAAARAAWRAARSDKLFRKKELSIPGNDMPAIRSDRVYRELKKRQRRFAVRIVHLERKMNRVRSREK